MDENSFLWLSSYLNPDETILWRGKPGKGHLLTKSDVFMIPFSLMWGGFAVFWEASVLAQGAPLLFKLWGIPFVLVGLYLIVGRFFHKSLLRKRTEYVVTDRRILRRCGKRVDILNKNSLPPMQTTVNADGSGSIVFGAPAAGLEGLAVRSSFWPGRSGEFTMDTIPEISRVLRAISTDDMM